MNQPQPFPSVTFPEGQYEIILKRHEDYKRSTLSKSIRRFGGKNMISILNRLSPSQKEVLREKVAIYAGGMRDAIEQHRCRQIKKNYQTEGFPVQNLQKGDKYRPLASWRDSKTQTWKVDTVEITDDFVIITATSQRTGKQKQTAYQLNDEVKLINE